MWGGYVFIYKPDHPKALNGKYVKRSVLVLEAKLGRYLRDGYENGTDFVEGPHYPAAHTWYAEVTMKDGIVVRVK